jgi:hypothetical protein
MVIGSEVHATRVSEKATVPLTNQSYNWSVDNRSKLVDVFYENLLKPTQVGESVNSY